MAKSNLVMLEAEHARLAGILDLLREEANADLICMLDKSGQPLVQCGEGADMDPAALASLTAGNVAATEGLARLVGEGSFTTLFHEGRSESLHISLLCEKIILLVVFGASSSLGLVRLRVGQRSEELAAVLDGILDRSAPRVANATSAASPFQEITDEDIDSLFR